MLTISDLTKSFGERKLFQEVSLQVNDGDRVGIVGPNGAGKSTLFAMILGTESPDAGRLELPRRVSVGFLPQESSPAGDETVLELASSVSTEFVELRRKLKAWDSAHPDDIDPHDNLHARFDELQGHEIEAKAKKILKGLSFRDSDFDRPAREMSGGWVMRAHLARLLVQEPALLMLDEPTNHLDLDSLLWFQGYLQGYPGAILVVSHDREFLNRIVTSIVEIRFNRLIRYRGNYDEYLLQREATEAQHVAAYKNQQREISRLMEFVNRFRAKNTKATQAQSKLKQIERMDKIEAPLQGEKHISFSFPQPQRSGLKVITLRDVHHAYGGNVVYRGMEFQAERGQRIVLVGPNGAGKSTLLKILAGVVAPQSGARELGHNVRAGYYSQYRVEMLHPGQTALEEALDTPLRVSEEFVRTLLGCFLFRGDDVFKRVSVLSGGEKSRLALVKLLLNPPNLLLMDEPTTHLDMPSIDALIAALDQFEGTLIFISHDVHLIRSLANHVVHINNGQLTHFPGPYQYYLDKTAALEASVAQTNRVAVESAVSPDGRSAKVKGQKRLEAEQRNARHRARREVQRRVHQFERDIAELEARQTELTAALENPATYEKSGAVMQINRELSDVQHRLEDLTAQWETEANRLAAMEN